MKTVHHGMFVNVTFCFVHFDLPRSFCLKPCAGIRAMEAAAVSPSTVLHVEEASADSGEAGAAPPPGVEALGAEDTAASKEAEGKRLEKKTKKRKKGLVGLATP